ncbi:MAG: recombination regulator RecX [Gammaproteobacteria bacterium]|nr:recombination regulator RecX [Gammaproteobacteria bacterium]
MPISDEDCVTESDAYASAIGLLARREHSARELLQKLAARGADVETAAAVLARLIHERLQSDARFTEAYLRQRSEKGYGPQRIQAELRERGVEEALIGAQLRQAVEEGEIDWFERAAAAYAKKYGGRPIEDMKERAKRMRFLQYRGFSHEQVAAALKSE